VSEESEAEKAGRDLVGIMVRLGETKARLQVALDALHTAMAATPLDMGHVTVMGDLAKGVAAQISEHDELIREFAQKVTLASREKEGA
jgi:hypothetical protein